MPAIRRLCMARACALGFKARRLAFAPSLLGCKVFRRAACRLVRLELQE